MNDQPPLLPDLAELTQAAVDQFEQEQSRSLLEAQPHAQLIVRRDGIIHMANLLAVQLFDYPVTMLEGSIVENFIPERFRDHHVKYREAYFLNPPMVLRVMGGEKNTGATGEVQLFILARYGVEKKVKIKVATLRNRQGTLASITFEQL